MPVPSLAATDASGNQTTSPISHTIPAGWAAGDLVIAHLSTVIRTVSSAPAGWTLIQSTTGISDNTYTYWKVLSAGDLGAVQSWTLNANPSSSRVVFHRVTGVDVVTPVNASDKANDAVSGMSHVSPSLTTTVSDCLVLRLTTNGGQVTSAASGDTGSKSYETTVTPGLTCWASSKAVAGVTGTGTYSTPANRQFSHVVIAIAPAASGGLTKQHHHYAQMRA